VTAYDYPGWVLAEVLEEGRGELPAFAGGSALDEARTYLGAPYEWGGMTERGIDCSGLVHMAYRRLGRLVPRDAWQQEEAGRRVADPEPGDVLVYAEPGKPADHVAFWLGGGRILHATGRDSLGVVEEAEPPDLAARRRSAVRL
jgi:cell wall-associated NlpC family hydrolase